ncbi:probable methylenetetrahydrofolate reductase [Tetranychus urticae]|uniref:probable methylenetetrahydrofolate reductase n=1 Tax=Tetranychus urticae TaxID=32264 RepID=UPI00077BC81F|nr:probable methylenetetrahydrofolate reductase [Tetranychus urticae]
MTFSKEPPSTSDQPVVSSVKLIDKITNYVNQYGKPFFSLEFFPPRNETELESFWPLLDQLKQGNPLFMDITWHSRSSLDPNNHCSSLAIAGSTLKQLNHETVLHLTCYDYDITTLESILNSAKSLGLRNILALRGDVPASNQDENKVFNGVSNNSSDVPDGLSNVASSDIIDNTKGEQLSPTIDQLSNSKSDQIIKSNNFLDKLTCALDLVKFIKTKYGDFFTIGVAGYPMGHPEAKTYSDDLNYLKSKVDAGADFIVTQLSFSADQYISFIKDCHAIGIKVPIIPGIFPIQTKASIRNISKLTKIDPPNEVKKSIEACKGDIEAIKKYGLQHAVDLCKKLISSDVNIPGLHFYTLNRDNCVTEILKQLNLWNPRSDYEESIMAGDIQNSPLVLPEGIQQPVHEQ